MSKSIALTVTNDLNQDQRMHRICDSLKDAGYQVELIGRSKQNSLPLLAQSFGQKRLKCYFQKGVLFYIEINLRLFFYLLGKKPDAVYAVDLDTITACGLVAKIKSIKLIHDAHEYFTEVPELEGKSLKKWIWNSVAKIFLPACHLRITVNQELAGVLGSKYGCIFEVVRSTPLLNDEAASDENMEKSKTPIILYQGMLNKGRGLEESIKAICKYPESVEFRIAGEGDLSKQLRAFTENLENGERIKFLGWLNPDELKKETKKAWVGLNLLSGNSLNYHYSLANKFFDYMHADVPSINMDFPAYRRICAENKVGICIQDLSEEHILLGLSSILGSKERYLNLKQNCSVAKLKYNWQNESKVLLDLLNQLLNDK